MTILFAYDGSESADAAIAAVGSLLHRDDAKAVVLSVSPVAIRVMRTADRERLKSQGGASSRLSYARRGVTAAS